MHAIKGGWVGQTFALAKSNESEGRKSRIRRSKEERKAMVESFIKKYQILNNGSFPSLNLTHKEVGGSFYTVREIVRDIIQENRVLGPAKLTQEKQSNYHQEQGPLGSIALEPQYLSSVSSNGSEFAINEYQSSGELGLVSETHKATPEHHVFDNGKVINGNHVDMEKEGHGELKDAEISGVVDVELNTADDKLDENEDLVPDGNYASPITTNGSLVDVGTRESHEGDKEEPHEPTQKKLQVNEGSEADNFGEESTATRSKMTPIAGDIEVETFPMKPVNMTTDLDVKSSEAVEMSHTFSEQGFGKVELFTGIGSSQTDGVNLSQDEKGVKKFSDPPPDKSGLLDNEVVEEQLDPLVGSSNCSNEGTAFATNNTQNNAIKQDFSDVKTKVPSSDLKSVTSEQSVETAGAKLVNSPTGMKTKGVGQSNGTIGQSKTEERMIEKETDVKLSGKPLKESNPTLDRINLESWDGSSGSSVRPQGNPLWAVIKACINVFVKFWTE